MVSSVNVLSFELKITTLKTSQCIVEFEKENFISTGDFIILECIFLGRPRIMSQDIDYGLVGSVL